MGFLVDETRTTPYISIEKGDITIKGRSIPEDAFEFYEPVLEACADYTNNPPSHTVINVHLDYVNSGSKKFITNLLTIFEKSYLEGNDFMIKWHYDVDDESMLDLGNDFKSIIKIPIQILQSND